MKFLCLTLIVTTLSLTSAPQLARANPGLTPDTNAQIAHGGGCRKSSPRGQCCHAGSKPYHCH